MGFHVLSLEVKKAAMWLFFLCPGQTRQAGGTIMNEAAIHRHTSALPVTCLPHLALITPEQNQQNCSHHTDVQQETSRTPH